MPGASMRVIARDLPEPKIMTKPAWKKPVIEYPKDAKIKEVPYKWKPAEKPIKSKKQEKPKPITVNPRKKRLPVSAGGKHPWTKDELDMLVRLFNGGVSYKEICLQLQTHNESTIKDKVSQLRRQGLICGYRSEAGWTQEQDEILIRMKREGKKLREIAPVVGKSQQTCSHRYLQLERRERE